MITLFTMKEKQINVTKSPQKFSLLVGEALAQSGSRSWRGNTTSSGFTHRAGGGKGCSHSTHPKFLDSKAFRQSDLEDVEAADVSRQLGQALLAAAAHTNQERVTLRGPKDSADATPARRQHAGGSRRLKGPGAASSFCLLVCLQIFDTKSEYLFYIFSPRSSASPWSKEAPHTGCLSRCPCGNHFWDSHCILLSIDKALLQGFEGD